MTATQGGSTITSAGWNGAGELTSYDNSAANLSAATYDGNGVRATATTGSATQDFVWNTVPSVPQLIMDSSSAYIYDGGTTPAEQISLSSGTASYLVSDSLGSVRGIVSSAGALTATTSYDAWGNPQTAGALSAYTPFGYGTITAYVNAIIKVIQVVTGHVDAADIAELVTDVLNVATMTLLLWKKIVKAYTYKGKHTKDGFTSKTFEDLFGQSYQSSQWRTCTTEGGSCGSPGKVEDKR